ncbi:MAG: GNAT family N-acetyltransferase [Desulfobacteraceae bacterium]|jgi:predicted GNAT family N-acyltransferase
MKIKKIQIREMHTEDADQVFELVKAGFDEFVKPDLTEEGVTEFFRAVQEFIYTRPDNHFIMIARSENKIIGMIDVKDNNHICLFFVAKEFQRKSVGGQLLENTILKSIPNSPQIFEITVNSSTFAVSIYKKLGFKQSNAKQMVNGIKFIPMVKTVHHQSFQGTLANSRP